MTEIIALTVVGEIHDEVIRQFRLTGPDPEITEAKVYYGEAKRHPSIVLPLMEAIEKHTLDYSLTVDSVSRIIPNEIILDTQWIDKDAAQRLFDTLEPLLSNGWRSTLMQREDGSTVQLLSHRDSDETAYYADDSDH